MGRGSVARHTIKVVFILVAQAMSSTYVMMKNQRKLSFCFTFILFLALPLLTQADEVTIVSDRWLPYNGTPKSPAPGYIIEIAHYALAKGGHSVNYQLASWDRSLAQVRAGKKNCVVGAYKNEAVDFIFPDIHQGVDQTVLYRKTGSDWQYTGVESLKKIRLGAIDGYDYSDDIDEYILSPQSSGQVMRVRGKYALEKILIALMNNEIDAVIDSSAVIKSTLKKQGWESKIEFAGNANILSKIYMACSPALKESAEYVKLVADGTRELRANGLLTEILSRYGVSDWHGLPAADN